MIRTLLVFAGLLVAFGITSARPEDRKDPNKLTVDLFGSVDDEKLAKDAPEGGVITTAKAWEALAKSWGLKDPAKVDFKKELLVVATTRGSKLNLDTKLDDKGDLRVLAISTRDLRPGFRYAIKSVSRDGVKTANGKELPRE